MRVLHVIARMNFGGTARYLVELHDGLTANGIENFIAAGHVEGKESIDPSAAGIRIIDIASLARSLNPPNDFKAALELRKIVAEIKPDIVHTHTFKAGLIARLQTGALKRAAQKNIKALGFDVVLQDSIYVDTLARNSVLRQTPEADEVVKKGRTIYLTINRVIAPQVDMPNLIGFSLKSAQTYLKVLGLRIGSINLVANRNKNVIIDQLVGFNSIAPGTKISSGTMINFTVGDGGNAVGIEVPDLIGLTVDMARSTMTGLGLIIGNITSAAVIQDTANAYVIQQTPNSFSTQLDSLGMPIRNSTIQGGSIDLIIDKVAPVIVKKDSIK